MSDSLRSEDSAESEMNRMFAPREVAQSYDWIFSYDATAVEV